MVTDVGSINHMKNLILGRRIKERLKNLKQTQGWLAEKMGLADNAVSKWILGKSEPSFSNLIKMAQLLKCSVGYLGGDEIIDDVAEIVEMARKMEPEARRYYRKSGANLSEPETKANGKQ